MEKKAVRVAYGEALVKLGEKNDKVVVLDADLASATMTNAFKMVDHLYIMTKGGPGNSSNMLLFYVYQTAFDRSKWGARTV